MVAGRIMVTGMCAALAPTMSFLPRPSLSSPTSGPSSKRNRKCAANFRGEPMIGLATESDEQMDRVCEFLERERRRVPGFHFRRNTIYVRFCHEDYSKGTALAELARLIGLGRDEIFAAGDHYNDLPMLDGRHARWVACPANAVIAVKTASPRRTATSPGLRAAKGSSRHCDIFGPSAKTRSRPDSRENLRNDLARRVRDGNRQCVKC